MCRTLLPIFAIKTKAQAQFSPSAALNPTSKTLPINSSFILVHLSAYYGGTRPSLPGSFIAKSPSASAVRARPPQPSYPILYTTYGQPTSSESIRFISRSRSRSPAPLFRSRLARTQRHAALRSRSLKPCQQSLLSRKDDQGLSGRLSLAVPVAAVNRNVDLGVWWIEV